MCIPRNRKPGTVRLRRGDVPPVHRPSGNVCPCDFVPLSFGNVLDERLQVIVRRMGEAMRQPRRHCFLQTNAALIDRHAAKHGYPLPPQLSVQVAAEAPQEPLPDYLQCVASHWDSPAEN